MPRGFTGQPATAFLTFADDAQTRAINTSSRVSADVSDTPSAGTASRIRNRQLPFEPQQATQGGLVPSGRGNSSNIIVSEREYESITRLISQADDRLGECLYNVANEIELMCQTIFVLPDAVPRCLNISETIKRSLGQFRSMTEDAALQTRNFVREITSIG